MERDKQIFEIIEREHQRQKKGIELIASENFVSEQVMQAMGSCLTNKYAEGYPGHRYYGGCQVVDEAESLAIERVKKLFGAAYANVQPHSGAQANMAVFMATMKPGEFLKFYYLKSWQMEIKFFLMTSNSLNTLSDSTDQICRNTLLA